MRKIVHLNETELKNIIYESVKSVLNKGENFIINESKSYKFRIDEISKITLRNDKGGYILSESGLSFLGLGIQQPDASWGNMLKEAQEYTNILYRPWLLTPGFLIFVAVLSFNLIGDTIRDVLDPKSKVR